MNKPSITYIYCRKIILSLQVLQQEWQETLAIFVKEEEDMAMQLCTEWIPNHQHFQKTCDIFWNKEEVFIRLIEKGGDI